MPDTIPDLWGDAITVDDPSPLMILLEQVMAIEQRTKGLIVAELIQRKSGRVTELLFDLKSESARHRSRLLVCRHLDDDVYPVWVTALPLRGSKLHIHQDPVPPDLGLDEDEKNATVAAFSQDVFIELVQRVLQSEDVITKIRSMIAKNNEKKQKLDRLIIEEPVAAG